MITKDKIREILAEELSLDFIKIQDDSKKHARHAEAAKSGGGHFSLLIVSPDFQGKGFVERHKMIYRILQDQMRGDIHALAIKAYTPEEYQSKKN